MAKKKHTPKAQNGSWQELAKKTWHFLWHDDSLLSWIVSVILAFLIIKFLFYPGIGLALGTSHPVVAVVSGSMEHDARFNAQTQKYEICGQALEQRPNDNLQGFWQNCGSFYEQRNISLDQFRGFPFANGFNTGDIMVLRGKKSQDIQVGDILVFASNQPDPIIHRIVQIKETDSGRTFTTKGDFNPRSFEVPTKIDEIDIQEDQVIGVATFRIPYVGYLKIIAFSIVTAPLNLFK